jgi:toxin-antitoxin system PIN domain toxin
MDLPDVNPLIYAADKASPHHAQAKQWLHVLLNSQQPFGISELILQATVRILTHPRIYVSPFTLDQALAFVDSVRSASNARVLHPGTAHWGIFVSQVRAISARGNDVTDAYHAALAIEHGCEFLTFDAGFARFPGLKWRKPF